MKFLDRTDRSWQGRGLWPFFPAPIVPQHYEIGVPWWDSPLVVCPNNRATLSQLAGADVRVIVIPTGGMNLQAALAFGLLSGEALLAAISQHLSESGAKGIIVPRLLFMLIQQAGKTKLGEAELVPGPDDFSRMADFLAGGKMIQSQPPTQPIGALERLRWASVLGLGQTILISIPLLLFGPAIWAAGIVVFWVALLSVASLWPLAPGKRGWLKGVIIGCVFALLSLFSRWAAPQDWAASLSPLWPVAFPLMGWWAGVVVSGAK